MATNKYFMNYSSPNEQRLFDSLVVESTKMHGVDTYYVAANMTNVDDILNEATHIVYDRAFVTEIYIESFNSFAGEGDLVSKFFANQINDQMVVSLPITSFNINIKANDESLNRPREGDLLFMPFNQKFFKIMFVEHESVFYSTGMLHNYQIKCELLTYTNQVFETGISEIDRFTTEIETYTVEDLETLHERDYTAKNNFFEMEKKELFDDSEFDPFKDILITSVKDKP